jgi:superfamily II DNA or RNA helicase/HKD family nuclease
MKNINESLLKSLNSGFIDKSIISNSEYLPQLLVNDKLSGKKILSTIDSELNNCDEFWISVAFVTASGIATLMNTLIELENKGINGKILVSQYLNFSQPEALKKLIRFKNIELKIAIDGNFHSKGYLFKKGKLHDLIIGSSNLTANALCLNKEWNLKVTAARDSYIIFNAISVFQTEFDNARIVNNEFISNYEILYKKQFENNRLQSENFEQNINSVKSPNKMQIEALANLEKIRSEGKSKALLISATGTGKTYLSAFDVFKVNPNKFLFVVHRANIAEAAMQTFQNVFGDKKSMGFYSGENKEKDKDFIFSTIQTISKEQHLNQFDSKHFDYIVIDESHRAGAESYKKIFDYFEPKFLLGMTATPERTDGLDIFKLFNHTIAYEIRLHKAMEEDMLSPFHYYGVTDISVNGKILDDKSDFSILTSKERIDRIIEKINLYGSDNGEVRGLIFCSGVEECKLLSDGFNKRGYKTIALSGSSSDLERNEAINRLESKTERLDYIFTVDIFNEGIDIPSVNQIIMLRPTLSSIIFIQQLGRGLRKTNNKEYLTVIDFIGNYSNNYLVPIALYGDTTYNKDTLRKLISSGSSLIPGTSTINFDKISKERIYEAIDSANLQLKKDLVKDYQLLKYRLGRTPMMIDFIEQGSRDPYQFVLYSKSYFNFVCSVEDNYLEKINSSEQKLLELFSSEINNVKRIEESIILKELIENNQLDFNKIRKIIQTNYSYLVSDKTIVSCLNNLNFKFVTENQNKKLVSVAEKYGIKTLDSEKEIITLNDGFKTSLKNPVFKGFLIDSINYAIKTYHRLFKKSDFYDGFILYQKYSRKDVFRILNWNSNPLAQNVGGYIVSSDKTNCPLFVTYKKEEHISETTKYNDRFINNSEFEMMSKSNRSINSPEILLWKNPNKLEVPRLPLFIKKSNDEGTDFYYMGDVSPIAEQFEQTTMPSLDGKKISVVKVLFQMHNPVEETIFNYLTHEAIETNAKDLLINNKVSNIIKMPFKIISLNEVKPYVNSVPLYDISVAAGPFSELQKTSDFEWIELPKPYLPKEGYFVCKITGESMNKVIPNGSWCLFKKDSEGTREGKIVLVEHYNIQDSDFGSGFTVKEYHSKKIIEQESWKHDEIILKPLSYLSSYEEIILNHDDLSGLKIVGIFVSVLG